MGRPKLQLVDSYGFYHLFINDVHDPKLCPECLRPKIWPKGKPAKPRKKS